MGSAFFVSYLEFLFSFHENSWGLFPSREYPYELLCFLLEAKEVNITVISRKLCPLPERFPAYSQAGTSEVWSSQAWWFHCRSLDQSIPACSASLSNPLHVPLNSSFLLPLKSGMCCPQLMSRNIWGLSLTLVSLSAGEVKPIYQSQAASSSLQPLLSHILGSAASQTFPCPGSKFLQPQYSLQHLYWLHMQLVWVLLAKSIQFSANR